MKNGILTLLMLVLVPMIGLAQQLPFSCGTEHSEAFIKRLKHNKKSYTKFLGTEKTVDVTYVPINFVIMGNTAGTTYATDEGNIIEMVCHLNEEYADQNIQFFVADFVYFNNDAAYNNPGDVNFNLISPNLKDDAINVLIGLNADPPGGGGPGTTLGYYSPSRDWVVVKKSEINGSDVTFPHEIGHYFSLAHPFLGWDCTFWNEAEHGNPVTLLTAPCSTVPVEFVNGSNCESAGDMLCDTPADYNLGFTAGGCNYNGNCMDPNGDLLMPMENNTMGYFTNCLDYEFTTQQKALIAADLENRDELATVVFPDFVANTGTPSLVAPANGEVLPYHTDLLFIWDDIDWANRYILEVDVSAQFNVNPIVLTVWGNSKVIEQLTPGLTYFWRVKPYSQYFYCSNYSAQSTFETGIAVATETIDFVQQWSVLPNPTQLGADLMIQLESNRAFEGDLLLLNLNGQVIRQQKAAFVNGQSSQRIDTEGLGAGVYVVSLRTREGVLTQRVVLQ